MSAPTLHIVPVTSAQDAGTLREDWDRILASSANASVFQSWEWVLSWWNRFGTADRRLFILAVKEGPATVAIVPWVITKRRLHGGIPFRTIEFLGAETTNGDHLDSVAGPGVDRAALASLLCGYLRTARIAWDLVRLDSVPADSATPATLADAARTAGFEASSQPLFACPAINLLGPRGDVRSLVREGAYQELEYKTRRLTRQAEWRTTLCAPSELRAGLQILFDLHAKRWELKDEQGAFRDAAKREFYNEVCAAFADRGWLRLHLMHINGAPAAALLCFRFGGTYTSMQNGFDPQWAKHSVGQILLTRAVQQAIAENCATFDFLRGPEPYKYDWGAVDRSTVRIELRRRTVANTLIRLAAAVRSRRHG